MYALVNYSGNQLLIKEGEKIKIPFIDQKVGSKLVFDSVMFLDDGKTKKIGNPYIKTFSIDAKIISHGKDKKVIVFKKKRRKGYQKKNGHKQPYTLLEINKIQVKKTAPKKAVKKTAVKAKSSSTKKVSAKTTKKTVSKKTTKK